jgi:hypothetical protein
VRDKTIDSLISAARSDCGLATVFSVESEQSHILKEHKETKDQLPSHWIEGEELSKSKTEKKKNKSRG